jgi:transcriptional regulator with GAF, ATPase, and Fis domain
MPKIIWLRPGGRTEDADYLERATGLKVVVSTVIPTTWEEIAPNVEMILMELPLPSPVVQHFLGEASHARVPIPMVIYDPELSLEEQLIGYPGIQFQHITDRLSTARLADVVRTELERAAGLALNAARAKEPWRELLIGESRQMQLLHSMIRLVGPRRSTVLITGETGTGKEMVARAVHMASSRGGSRMVSVNCAAIPENLVESELFGHSKGAFTGAVNDRVGRFEQAHRSTIFLDEIGEIPLDIQPKLLRVLQERELQRVGGANDIQIDTRVIAASNQDLEQAVADRRFREDLLYRLKVVPIVVPPLRDRASDIALLADHFIEKICRREGIRPKTLSSDAVRRLLAHEWPGNVRQLEHTIEMAVALSGERERLYSGDIRISEPRRNTLPMPAPEINLPQESGGINLEKMVGRVEQMLIQEALRQCGGNKAKAASSLGIPRTTLVYKLRSQEVCA